MTRYGDGIGRIVPTLLIVRGHAWGNGWASDDTSHNDGECSSGPRFGSGYGIGMGTKKILVDNFELMALGWDLEDVWRRR